MRAKTTAVLAAALTLSLTAVAQAHVSLHPNTIPAGAFVTLNVRVPGEEAGAYAYKLDMQIPPGFTAIDTQNVPGWSVKEVMKKLATPIQTDNGPVSEEVSEIIWSGDRTTLGRLDNGTFIQLPLSIAMPANIAGQSLAFKTLEYYSNGKVVHWIGSPSSEFPAPMINVTAKGGVIQEVAGGEAGPTSGQSPTGQGPSTPSAGATKSNGASKGLAITALVLGALGLLAGLSGLLVARRGRAGIRG